MPKPNIIQSNILLYNYNIRPLVNNRTYSPVGTIIAFFVKFCLKHNIISILIKYMDKL